MDATNIIKNTMMASLGLIATNSTDSVRYFVPTQVECHTIISLLETPSSTRFNNSERFSLEQLKLNKRKLESIKQLKANWNSYDGQVINEAIISKVISILPFLDYQPQIFPTGRGTIQIEKYIDEKNLVEIEISENEIFAYQVINGEEKESLISVDEIKDLISEIYA